MSFLLQVRGFAQLRGGLLKFCTWLRTQNQYPREPICTSVSLDRMSTLGIVRDNSAVGLQTGTGSIGPDWAGPGPPDGPEDRDFILRKNII